MSRNPSLDTALRHLKLPAFGQHYARLAEEATAANLSYDRYLQALAEQELAQRDLARQRRCLQQAGFPVLKELADFDWSAIPQLNRARILDLAQGSYLERAESAARTLGATRETMLGAERREPISWLPMIIVAGEQQRFAELIGEAKAEDGEIVQEYLVWDTRTLSSLHTTVRAARDNARSIRDHLTQEAWEQINGLYLWMKSTDAREEYERDRHGFYARIRRSMLLLTGIMRSTMLRDDALEFIRLGAVLERAGQTARILDVHHHAITGGRPHLVVDTALWLSLLRACAGFEPFMRRNRGKVSGEAIAEFLVLEPRFPRSVRYSLDSAAARIKEIRYPGEGPGERTQERLGQLRGWLIEDGPAELGEGRIHDLLTRVVDDVHAVAEEIGRDFLGYSG
ncbi:MAG: alpha-E domain-containing protein [Deltaproteobacteria bacterium]|nr:alpha-E domain-containing protein [Deltaproteobacteria bacterium]